MGLDRESPSSRDIVHDSPVDYQSLSGSTLPHPAKANFEYPPCIYRGLVPAKNITEHDFAINGAIVSAT